LAHNRILVCSFLAAIVFVAFWPTLGNNFVGYDDGEYVTDNVRVNTGLRGQNIVWAFTTAHSSNWHPLTWLSHALDCALFGLNPTGHHLTSLLLHIANTILLFLWLSVAIGFVARSAFVAAFFGLHPLHVESVAWVAERKDVLCTLFWLLTLIAYAGYVSKPVVSRYVLVAALFTAGGAGVFLGMMLTRRIGMWIADERRAGLFIGWALLAHGLLFSVAGLMPTLASMAVWVALSRMVLGAEFGFQETMMMRVLPDDYRGRVFTTDRSLELATMAISTIITGWLLTWFGPRSLMIASGLLSASPGLVWLLALWFARFRVPTRAVRESYGD